MQDLACFLSAILKLMGVDKSEVLPRPENIAAVMVTYHPEGDFVSRIRRILSQVRRVIVVDNSDSPSTAPLLGQLETLGVECIKNPRNLGLGTGLNQGLQRATDLGFSFVLTLDQDTVVDENMIDTLTHVWQDYPCRESIAILGSNARSPISARLAIRRRPTGEPFTEEKVVITSGSLISLSVSRRLGPVRSDFFIEGIDLEYCLRARAHGFRVLATRQAVMTHAGGKMDERRLLGRVVLVAHHEPWRYYYTVRNLICVARLYFRQEPAWVFATSVCFAKTFVKTVLFERDRWLKLVSIVSGIKDGVVFPLKPLEEDGRFHD